MKNIFKFYLTLLASVFFYTSCKKEGTENTTFTTNSENIKNSSSVNNSTNFVPLVLDKVKLDAVVNDPDFIIFINKIEEIVKTNISTENKLNENQLSQIYQQLKVIKTNKEGQDIFESFGIKNAEKLFKLFSELTPLIFKVINKNYAFNDLNKTQVNFLFNESIKYYKKKKLSNSTESNLLAVEDKCSKAYANGMSACDTNFTIATATSVLSGVFVVVGTGGTGIFLGAGTASAGIAAAYGSLYVCQVGVVDAWRDCRGI